MDEEDPAELTLKGYMPANSIMELSSNKDEEKIRELIDEEIDINYSIARNI